MYGVSIDRCGDGLAAGGEVEECVGRAGRIVEQSEDLAEVGGCRLDQLEAVPQGFGQGSFVGQDDPGIKGLQADLDDERAAADRSSCVDEALLKHVHGRTGILHEDSLRAPIGPQGGGVLVAVARNGGVDRPAGQLKGDDVVRISRKERLSLRGRDHIVGRGCDHRQIAFRSAVAKCGEGTDASHERYSLGRIGGLDGRGRTPEVVAV